MDHRTNSIIRLYEQMPGAPGIPVNDETGEALWRNVEGNEHWNFCAAIVDLVAENLLAEDDSTAIMTRPGDLFDRIARLRAAEKDSL